MTRLGVKNGRLAIFRAAEDATLGAPSPCDQAAQILTGGMRQTLLPLGMELLRESAKLREREAVIMVVDNDRASVACMLAAMELRLVCVLISRGRIELLERIQQQTGIKKLVIVDDRTGSLDVQEHQVLRGTVNAPHWLSDPAISDGCVCMLTSGSIGEPKVVACSWKSMLLQGESTQQELFPDQPARIICATSISHAFSINAIYTLFSSTYDAQSELCFAPSTESLQALLAQPKHKLTVLYGTPGTYTALVETPPRPLHVDVAYCAGTRLSPDLFRQVLDHSGLRLVQNYGSTEMGDIAAWFLNGKQLDDETSEMFATQSHLYVGSLWPGVQVTVEDSGEVLVQTPWQSMGYVADCRLDLRNGAPHRSGDRGFVSVDADGVACLWLQDRLRPLLEIPVNGKAQYFAPEDVERVFSAHPQVSDALALRQKRSTHSLPVRVRVILVDDATVTASELLAWGVEQVPAFRGSLSIITAMFLPCSPAGKLIYA